MKLVLPPATAPATIALAKSTASVAHALGSRVR